MNKTEFSVGVGSGENASDATNGAIDDATAQMNVTGGDVDFVAVFASPKYDQQRVVDTARHQTDDATLIGASSAGEFTNDGSHSESVVVMLISSDSMDFHVGVGEGVAENAAEAVADAASTIPDKFEREYVTGLNFHDGLAGRGEEVVMLAYQELPMSYTGASAGDDRQLDETFVYADDSVVSDGVALGVMESDLPFGRAVGHGHKPISDGYRITESDGSVVREMDGENPFELWKDAVREPAKNDLGVDVDSLTPDDPEFVELLTRYEFGVQTGDDSYKIRWPGLTPTTDGPLNFATEMPEGIEVFVMDGDSDELYDAQQRVGEEALGDVPDGDFVGAMVFDCICQADILKSDFGSAVRNVGDTLGVQFGGMEVYGEVGLNDDDMRGYHNATSSVVLIPE